MFVFGRSFQIMHLIKYGIGLFVYVLRKSSHEAYSVFENCNCVFIEAVFVSMVMKDVTQRMPPIT